MKRAWIAALAVAVVALGGGALLMVHARRHRGGGAAGRDGGVAAGGKWAVEGRVIDRLGRPVMGARVTAAGVVGGTDTGGRYVLRLGSGAVTKLRVEADGFVAEELGDVVPPQAGLEVTLSRRLALEGVVRAHGAAAGEAEITIAGASGTRTAKSGPDGAFSFAGLAEGRYALRAVRGNEAAYLDGVMVAAGDGGTGVITVELKPATSVAGRLRERGGQPIPGGEVTLAEADGAPLPRSVTTDNEGNFRFVAVLPGSYVVGAHAEGFYPAEPRPLRVGSATAPVSNVDVRLDPGATVEGRVIDERAQPVEGAAVEVSGEAPDGTPIAMTASSGVAAATGARLEPSGELGILRGPLPYPPPVPIADAAPAPKQFRTDDKGLFRVTGLPAGRLVVAATHPDFARGTSEPMHVVAGASLKVTVVLSRGVEVRGRVVDDRGDPVGGAELVGDGAALATTDAHGEYTIAHLAKAMTLTVRATGFLPATRAVAPSERGPFDVTLRKAEGRLAGDVVDDRGAPLSAARVEITAPPMPVRWVTTDRTGRFGADGLGPGPYRVVVTHADFAPATFEAVAPTADAHFTLALGGGIDGEVRDARLGGVPAGLRLEVTAAGGKPQLLPVQSGRFEVTALPAGRATLTAMAPGYVTLVREVDVTAGERLHDVTVRDVRLEMERGGAVVGSVRDDHGDPAVGALVAVGTARVHCDREGGFRVDGLAPGRVRVTAEKEGATAADDAEVRAGDEARVELRLR
ncbi:MAG TPA: carboxypeptidase regulatory-like domain-containing protein [Polyangia bacterium]|nr:carboxypeptidase regulatory-like domain-containing protein [Polyangia bacterium]